MTEIDNVDVLVIGGGPVGLAAGLLLRNHGLTGIIAERRRERSGHPKARGIRQRASELAAAWGLGDDLRALAMPHETHRFIYTETLSGDEIARTATLPSSGDDSWGSVPLFRVAQDRLEDVLEQHLVTSSDPASLAVVLRRGATVTSLTQDDEGLVAVLTDEAGETSQVRARYAILADGVGSRLRRTLGIELGSDGPAPYWHSVFWRGDLSAYVADRPAIMYYTRTGGRSLVGLAPAGDERWVTIVQNPPSEERPAPLGSDDAIALIRRAVGVDELPVDVVSSETFRISADVASKYRSGRVFVAGDAAHALPPTGGFGINTGFADVHNLVWKLAAVMRGKAPSVLLESYEGERLPVAASNVAWSSGNARRMVAIKAALAADDRVELRTLLAAQGEHVDPVAQDLGFTYVPMPEGTPPAYAVATLGARAPHADIMTADGIRSTIDLFEGELTLVAGTAWAAAAGELSAEFELSVLSPPPGGRYPVGDGAVLVRPDGHVGWIAQDAQGDLTDRLRAALADVLTGRFVD